MIRKYYNMSLLHLILLFIIFSSIGFIANIKSNIDHITDKMSLKAEIDFLNNIKHMQRETINRQSNLIDDILKREYTAPKVEDLSIPLDYQAADWVNSKWFKAWEKLAKIRNQQPPPPPITY